PSLRNPAGALKQRPDPNASAKKASQGQQFSVARGRRPFRRLAADGWRRPAHRRGGKHCRCPERSRASRRPGPLPEAKRPSAWHPLPRPPPAGLVKPKYARPPSDEPIKATRPRAATAVPTNFAAFIPPSTITETGPVGVEAIS